METQPVNLKKRWTGRDRFTLLRLCEKYDMQEMAKKLGRTQNSIRNMLHKEGVGYRRATVCVQEFCRQSGYSYKQVHRAKKELGQVWGRASNRPKSKYTITDAQIEEICEFFKKDKNPDKPFGHLFWKYVDRRDDGHWLWTGTKVFSVCRDGKQYSFRPSRLAWILVRMVWPDEGQQVFRKCHVEDCINPAHCELK